MASFTRHLRPILLALTGLSLAGPSGSAFPSDQTFDSRGVKIHYVVQGQGQPVVLIHGLYSSAFINWQAPGTMSLLSKNYQVIALDLPGHGQSDKPQDESAYGPELVADIVRLLDRLDIKKAHIVGYSMGGMIAARFLATHQDRSLTGVLGGMGWLREGSGLQKIWPRLFPGQGGATPPACARSLGKLALTRDELNGIRVPVVVLVGDQDPVKDLYVAPLQQFRKDWPVIEIRDAGHMNCIVKPEFKQEIQKWLDSHH
jgi:pimeloyl-ACP methyl ester carboxylesterase